MIQDTWRIEATAHTTFTITARVSNVLVHWLLARESIAVLVRWLSKQESLVEFVQWLSIEFGSVIQVLLKLGIVLPEFLNAQSRPDFGGIQGWYGFWLWPLAWRGGGGGFGSRA